jgi:hypothetical protein
MFEGTVWWEIFGGEIWLSVSTDLGGPLAAPRYLLAMAITGRIRKRFPAISPSVANPPLPTDTLLYLTDGPLECTPSPCALSFRYNESPHEQHFSTHIVAHSLAYLLWTGFCTTMLLA